MSSKSAHRPDTPPRGLKMASVQRVNVDFPIELLARIDAEAARIGVARQAFIKLRIADALPKEVK